MILWCAGVYQHPSTFRSVTLQPVGVDKATIWQIKENFLSFDMMHVRFISPQRLHGKIKWRPLPFFPLVLARKGRVRVDSGKERTQANEFRVNDLAISLIQSGMSMSATRSRP